MQRLGYFGGGVARVPGTEEVPEPEGELVVFEAFFAAGLRLPAHRFVGEVLRRFNVQIHQLTPNAVVALSKYVWAMTSYGGQPSVPYANFSTEYMKMGKVDVTGLLTQYNGEWQLTVRTSRDIQ